MIHGAGGTRGGWQAKYIPAFVRRYPFVFSSRGVGKTFTLCIDEAFPGFNQSGRGERLFGDDGKPTPYVQNVLLAHHDEMASPSKPAQKTARAVEGPRPGAAGNQARVHGERRRGAELDRDL
jgi:hypothetical protein